MSRSETEFFERLNRLIGGLEPVVKLSLQLVEFTSLICFKDVEKQELIEEIQHSANSLIFGTEKHEKFKALLGDSKPLEFKLPLKIKSSVGAIYNLLKNLDAEKFWGDSKSKKAYADENPLPRFDLIDTAQPLAKPLRKLSRNLKRKPLPKDETDESYITGLEKLQNKLKSLVLSLPLSVRGNISGDVYVKRSPDSKLNSCKQFFAFEVRCPIGSCMKTVRVFIDPLSSTLKFAYFKAHLSTHGCLNIPSKPPRTLSLSPSLSNFAEIVIKTEYLSEYE